MWTKNVDQKFFAKILTKITFHQETPRYTEKYYKLSQESPIQFNGILELCGSLENCGNSSTPMADVEQCGTSEITWSTFDNTSDICDNCFVFEEYVNTKNISSNSQCSHYVYSDPNINDTIVTEKGLERQYRSVAVFDHFCTSTFWAKL